MNSPPYHCAERLRGGLSAPFSAAAAPCPQLSALRCGWAAALTRSICRPSRRHCWLCRAAAERVRTHAASCHVLLWGGAVAQQAVWTGNFASILIICRGNNEQFSKTLALFCVLNCFDQVELFTRQGHQAQKVLSFVRSSSKSSTCSAPAQRCRLPCLPPPAGCAAAAAAVTVGA